jgi:guanine deaminase
MCLAAILWARIKTIYYGCTREDAKKLGFDDELFYRVISKRKHPLIKMKQTYRKQCLATFTKWKNSRNYHLY